VEGAAVEVGGNLVTSGVVKMHRPNSARGIICSSAYARAQHGAHTSRSALVRQDAATISEECDNGRPSVHAWPACHGHEKWGDSDALA